MQRYRSGNESERCQGQIQRGRIRAAVEISRAISEREIAGTANRT